MLSSVLVALAFASGLFGAGKISVSAKDTAPKVHIDVAAWDVGNYTEMLDYANTCKTLVYR